MCIKCGKLWIDVDYGKKHKTKTILMANAGYSGKSLIEKLGIKPAMRILLIHPPENYFELLGQDLSKNFVSKNETPGFIHLFAKNTSVFKEEMKTVLKLVKKNTAVIVWVSWYKKTSHLVSDLSENIIRDFALQNNLVDIKVCAVDTEWSGLKLVVPVAKR